MTYSFGSDLLASVTMLASRVILDELIESTAICKWFVVRAQEAWSGDWRNRVNKSVVKMDNFHCIALGTPLMRTKWPRQRTWPM